MYKVGIIVFPLWTPLGLRVISCGMNTQNIGPMGAETQQMSQLPTKVRYLLYARKSSESEERQILSIDSQVKEMLQLAEREGLEIAEIRRESHSAKATGQRPVFNEILKDIRSGKFNGILTWAPDRIARNAGDLGAVVDLMDQKLLLEIRTYGQRFTDSPNEKFLLMILGSQAKLENDARGVNVKRGLRTRVEMGLWPGMAPLGYLNQKMMDKKCQVIVDSARAPIVKRMISTSRYSKNHMNSIKRSMAIALSLPNKTDTPSGNDLRMLPSKFLKESLRPVRHIKRINCQSLKRASLKLNILRVFLRLMKEVKTLDNKKYITLQTLVDEIGRMLGGWIKSTKER